MYKKNLIKYYKIYKQEFDNCNCEYIYTQLIKECCKKIQNKKYYEKELILDFIKFYIHSFNLFFPMGIYYGEISFIKQNTDIYICIVYYRILFDILKFLNEDKDLKSLIKVEYTKDVNI